MVRLSAGSIARTEESENKVFSEPPSALTLGVEQNNSKSFGSITW
jgi:hypothetical protein